MKRFFDNKTQFTFFGIAFTFALIIFIMGMNDEYPKDQSIIDKLPGALFFSLLGLGIVFGILYWPYILIMGVVKFFKNSIKFKIN